MDERDYYSTSSKRLIMSSYTSSLPPSFLQITLALARDLVHVD